MPRTDVRRLPRRRFLLGCPALVLATHARAEDGAVQLYAPLTVRPALDAALALYRQQGGAVTAVYAPTPVLVRQLAGGAPADILLTADPDWMNRAAEQGLIDPASRVDLLTTDLVLAAPPDVPAAGMLTPGYDLAKLIGSGRVAMCDPEMHPAGRYAKQALQALDLWKTAAPQIAIAESAPGAVTLVDRGEAKAAVVFRSDLHGDDKSAVAGVFPASSHAPIVYPVALTRTHHGGAAGVIAFLRSDAAMAVFGAYGYRAPGG